MALGHTEVDTDWDRNRCKVVVGHLPVPGAPVRGTSLRRHELAVVRTSDSEPPRVGAAR